MKKFYKKETVTKCYKVAVANIAISQQRQKVQIDAVAKREFSFQARQNRLKKRSLQARK